MDTDISSFLNSIPVMGPDGQLQYSSDSTRYESDVAPLSYDGKRLVLNDDYVLHVRYEDGVAVSAEFAQVWKTLYYDDGQPIGVSLKPANHDGSPTISMFSVADDSGVQKRYFRTTVTLNQPEVCLRILPLTEDGEKNTNADYDWFEKRVWQLAKTHGIASFALALFSKEDEKKVKYFTRAAKQGYDHAFMKLSWHFKEGWGVSQDMAKALNMLKMGKSDPGAKYELALAYIVGEHVKKDEKLALKLLKSATHQYNFSAYLLLGKYYRHGSFEFYRTGKIDYASTYEPRKKIATEAATCFYQLANEPWSGQAIAKYYLADCLEYGIGIEVDIATAIPLYNEAMETGDLSIPEIQEAYFKSGNIRVIQSVAYAQNGDNDAAKEFFEEGMEIIAQSAGEGHAVSKLFWAQELIAGNSIQKNADLGFTTLDSIDLNELSKKDRKTALKLLSFKEKI